MGHLGFSTVPVLWSPDMKRMGKTLILGKIEGKRRRGATEDEMVAWHHQFNGHELRQTLGDSEGQGGLMCCSPWACSWT